MSLARIILVEDEPFVSSMLSAALAALNIDIVATCVNAREAIASVEGNAVDVAVLDLDLGPGPTGVDIAYALRGRVRDIGIVVLTSFSDPRILDPQGRALPRGTRYVIKSELSDPTILRDLILETRREPLRPVRRDSARVSLTANQIEILRLVALGHSNSSIAERMHVGEKAIERTISRILDVLDIDRDGANVRIQLARSYALMAGKALA